MGWITNLPEEKINF